jgi:NAD(P)-dependent dehydrogenase (short-subunit alcohol dehydrogenase family)
MREAGGGRIINISSVWGKERWFGMASLHAAAYCASKFGVNGLTQALSYEWRPYNIRVNSVCPGPVDTAFAAGAPRDRERILPEDVADLVVYLACEEARHITGEAIIVDKWRLEAGQE